MPSTFWRGVILTLPLVAVIIPSSVSQLTLPRCGETYNVASGGIFHKPFEPVLDNERCVWVIASPSASGYKLKVEFLGPPTNQPGSGQELIFTGVKYGATNEPTMTTMVPLTTGEVLLDECNLAIITFHSGPLNGSMSSGFALMFNAVDDKNITKTSALSTHTLLESPHFDIKYPAGATYQPCELATMIFPPLNNIHEGQQKRLWYKRTTLEDTICNDSLFVYEFQKDASDGTASWVPTTRICGNVESYLISHDDLVLVIFQTDAVNQYAGFYFSFVAC